LSVRTGIPLNKIQWAYFDDKDYYAVNLAEDASRADGRVPLDAL
jgi:hypothetical protein